MTDQPSPRPRRASLRSLEAKAAVHDVQLENGQKAFAAMTSKINELDKAVTPKPIHWPTIIFGGIGVLGSLVGVVWLLAFLFSDRPTRGDVDKSIDSQRQILQTQATDIRELRDQQIEQKMLIKAVETQVGETDRKIDVLLNNTAPAAPPPRR